MIGFRPGHQHLNWVALLAVLLLLAFVIPNPLFGAGAPITATSHVAPLGEVAATGAWVAWGAGLATQMQRRRRTPRRARITPNGSTPGTADGYETLQRLLENPPGDEIARRIRAGHRGRLRKSR